MVEFDIVIATKDRPAALRASIPSMVGQSRKPRAIIIVDSSVDHSATRDVVSETTKCCSAKIIVINSLPGLTRQRNIGLKQVTTPIVMFPDDDSILFPDTAESIMRVYERDTEKKVAAVCAAESPTPPSGILEVLLATYQMSMTHRIMQRIGHTRARLERWAFPDPFILCGRAMREIYLEPDWFLSENAVVVEWMTGFRMSFRTEVIRRYGFDENFGGYALFEDVDASFNAMKSGLVVGARNAQIYHHRMPGGRGNERRLGVTQILNRAYVICKHSAPESNHRTWLIRYGQYKLAQYAFRLGSSGGRERFAGAWAAQKYVNRLLQAPKEDLATVYKEVLQESLKEN